MRILKQRYIDYCKSVNKDRHTVVEKIFMMNFTTFQNKMRSSKWTPSELARMADAMNISDEDLGKIIRQEAQHQKMNEI